MIIGEGEDITQGILPQVTVQTVTVTGIGITRNIGDRLMALEPLRKFIV